MIGLAAFLLAATTIQGAVESAMSKAPFDRALWFVRVEDEKGNLLYEQNGDKLAIPASVRKLGTAAAVSQCLGLSTQFHTELWRDGDDVILRGDGDPSFGSDRYASYDRAAFAPFVRALQDRRIRRVRDVVADVSLFDRLILPYQWKLGNLTSASAAPVDAITYAENLEPDEVPVASPALWAAEQFREALSAAGIEVVGTIRAQYESREWKEKLAEVASPSVYELLATTLKPSHNLFAETLFKRTAGSYERARAIEAEFLQSIGVGETDFRFVDGSGLAPDDLVTPAAVIKILRWMDKDPVWWNLLAIPGEQEGTLRRRLLPLADRLRAKTGSVAGVNSLAGIVRGSEGGTRYFVIIINHHTGSGSTTLIDEITTALSDF